MYVFDFLCEFGLDLVSERAWWMVVLIGVYVCWEYDG